MKANIYIDSGAGPCFGVQRAIQMAEELLEENKELACLGDLIHNDEEIKRLEKKGLQIVSHCQIVEQSGKNMLFRTHGETPSTYRIAENYNVEIVDATCPIVKELQNQVIKLSKKIAEQNGQLILFGDIYHAEIIALKGYCNSEFHIVRNVGDINKLNTRKPTVILSQTTKYQAEYKKIVKAFEHKRKTEKATKYSLEVVESICKYVAKRDMQLIDFLGDKDILVFVSGRKSSNGKYLFKVGKKKVKRAYFISNPDELQKKWFQKNRRIGISGATSTPIWLLNETQLRVEELLK
ncbi:MAG: 4-hydroxy-3-methylbut-2-enyl diphosphate reductase [Bacteroidales bacterium]|jgi:4-hydroxy-3-methylbut-2-enyl diphosphate reductase|nr:4-hydroxy-3-methylbut-2-enyl diphosphate reductase [Bacteroidales bacterium]